MPKRLIKKYFPDQHTIKEHKHLKVFGSLLHNQDLWHLNRRSFAGAIAVGFFVAFIPLPTQMVIAAAAAIALGVNLPVSVATVWVTNPVTMPPMFFAAYWLGAWVLDVPMDVDGFLFTLESVMESLSNNWKPFLLGCLLMGIASSAIGYLLARGVWRLIVIRKWRLKKKKNEP